jgi:hypothetical protein
VNRRADKLRKTLQASRRHATQIIEIAEQAQLDLADTKVGTAKARQLVVLRHLGEIISIARLMDARTGTIDPSAKKVAK